MTKTNAISPLFRYLRWLVYLLVSIVVLLRPTEAFPDTQGYIDMAINRTPGYPLFVEIIELISGSAFEWVIKLAQLILGLAAVHYFNKLVSASLKLKPLWSLVLTSILLIPYVYNLLIANRILSEALSYPLFLICTAQIFHAFSSENERSLVRTLPFLFLLLITRSQFLYIWVILLLLQLFLSWKNGSLKKQWLNILLILLIPVASSLTDRTYHKMVHNEFVSTPWTSFHFMSLGIFVSDAEDAQLFEDGRQQNYFEKVYGSLSEKGLTAVSTMNDPESIPIVTYTQNYSEIAVRTVVYEGMAVLDPAYDPEGIEGYIEVERICKEMAPVLIKDNFGSWLKVYLGNFTHGYGNARYTALYFLLFLIGLWMYLKRRDTLSKFILLTSGLAIFHGLLVALGPHTIKRVMFYHDWVLFAIVIAMVNGLSTGRSENS